MSISNHNRSKAINWGIDSKEFGFKKLSELPVNTVIRVRGCFISKDTGYGESPVIITDSDLVDLPKRYIPDIRDIMANPEDVEQIKAGKAGFKYEVGMSEKTHRNYFSVEFVDI